MLNEKDMYVLKKISVKGSGDMVGIILETDSSWGYVDIITTEGGDLRINPSKIQEVSIVRGIDKKVRDMMNKYGKEQKVRYNKLCKLKKELEELESEKEKEETDIKDRIIDIMGLLTRDEFNEKLRNNTASLVPIGYELSILSSSMYKNISVYISKDIAKYASPDEYAFLYLEHDRTLQMSYDGEEYKKAKTRYEKQLSLPDESLVNYS